ncbi:Cl- channel voltage-gated family protein [Ferroglobus placidus DSM 10642]|uniref:Cl-channel voltage-gated family protein n=1 Tax=Ferroglobus placidus (strain DSM 10642 / AEDII12DO) TaxID=589924 RepID=D3RXS1_FERPA|nr:chloride channel protein [Ferroglobus placidus]ADC65284.1 Cl- channel voltage-gated family protein [Ferroglobus placidus DSM 10642]
MEIRPPLLLRHLLILSIIVGIFSGLAAFVFFLMLDVSSEFFFEVLDSFNPPAPKGETSLDFFSVKLGIFPLWILPAIGGLLSGVIVYKLAPEAEGHGTDAVIRAFHRLRGKVRWRVPFVKAVASAITIGSGGSAGREGPIAQIGSGVGAILADILKLSDKDRRILLVCGVAGGIGSIFRAPFGGALFGVEVLYKRDAELDAIIPAFVSSITAFTVFEVLMSHVTELKFASTPIFIATDVGLQSPVELFFHSLTGILAAGVAIAYVKCFYSIHNLFRRLKAPNILKPFVGGIITGAIGVFVPQALGMSYGYVQLAIDGKLVMSVALLILFGKILATSFTVGSGGSGGVFAPSIVIGSMLGAVVGDLASNFAITGAKSNFVLVGMSAFISAVAKTPLASIMMVLEMTGSYKLLPALMLASTLSYYLSGDVSIYSEQVNSRVESPAHRREMTVDVLENIKVKEAMTPADKVMTLSPKNTISDVLLAINSTGHLGYPVVENGKLVGIITLEDVLRVPEEKRDSVKVEEVMTKEVITISPEASLEDALRLLEKYKIGRLPVVEDSKLVGLITRSDIIRAHAKAISSIS